VFTDASAMSSAIWHALSVCSGRHCECHGANGYGADEYNLSNHVFLKFGGEDQQQRARTACVPLCYDRCEINV
jgi:hypothetical protein